MNSGDLCPVCGIGTLHLHTFDGATARGEWQPVSNSSLCLACEGNEDGVCNSRWPALPGGGYGERADH